MAGTASPSKVRFHRILGWIAVLHAAIVAAIFIGLVFLDSPSGWFKSSAVLQEAAGWFFVVLATLWFLWPFVLIFHSGRSVLRVLLPLLIAYPFYFIWSHPYSNFLERGIDREKLGLPLDVDLSPHEILGYMFWYGVGWVDAKKDAKAGRLILESYGFGTFTPGAPKFSASTRRKYHIAIAQIAGCFVSKRDFGHAKGHNDAMISEIRRRFGNEIVTTAEQEEIRLQKEYAGANGIGRNDAERDVRTGRLVLEVFASANNEGPDYKKVLCEQYEIDLREMTAETDAVSHSKTRGHADGYNEVSTAEIERRFGREVMKTVYSAQAKYSQLGPVDE